MGILPGKINEEAIKVVLLAQDASQQRCCQQEKRINYPVPSDVRFFCTPESILPWNAPGCVSAVVRVPAEGSAGRARTSLGEAAPREEF